MNYITADLNYMLIDYREHLYRRHLLPPQCHRCCTTFSNDVTLREHQRDPRGCDVREQMPLEGFDKEQERHLKSKKKSQVHQTEEEKWKGVYRILFPDDGEEDIPTPYIEYQPCTGQDADKSSIFRFQEFSRLELPRLVRRTLEAVIEQEAQPLEDKMKEKLVDIVQECQTQLLTMFRTFSGGSSNNPTSLSNNVVTATELPPSPQTMGLVQQAAHERGDVFEEFDSMSAQKTLTSQTQRPSEIQVTVAAPKLPTSSNSSDSGYDSTWLPTQPHEASLDVNQLDFDLAADFTQPEYVDLGGYFGLFENRMDTMPQVSSAMMNADPCSWSFIESMPGVGDVGAAGHDSLEDPSTRWHM